jgi:hypothetical protein
MHASKALNCVADLELSCLGPVRPQDPGVRLARLCARVDQDRGVSIESAHQRKATLQGCRYSVPTEPDLAGTRRPTDAHPRSIGHDVDRVEINRYVWQGVDFRIHILPFIRSNGIAAHRRHARFSLRKFVRAERAPERIA